MFFVYVLRSQTSGRSYVGYTTDVVHRVGQHNHGITRSTKNRGPWELLHQEEFATRAAAMSRERFLKSGKGREELRVICALARA
jgi:putative endonuclease